MGLERRGNGLYYYRKKRVDGKVKSIYCGKASAENPALEEDRKTRLLLFDRNKNLELVEVEERLVLEMLKDLDKEVREITNSTLLQNGFYNHKGQWRKKRNGNQKETGE